MASGAFQSTLYTGAGNSYKRYVEVIWSSTNNIENNNSTITWNAYARSPNNNNYYVSAKYITVTINEEETELVGSEHIRTYKDTFLGNGTIVIPHDANGSKKINVSIKARFYEYSVDNSTYSGEIEMTPNPVYSLSVSAGIGSSIVVNRTFCPVSNEIGEITTGEKKLYHNDELKIIFTPSSNYNIVTHTVNNIPFTSGNTYTVSDDVVVDATATALKSVVGATDANIGSSTTITITRYNSTYKHTLVYSFGNLSGTIATETSDTSIAWTVPISFYTQIPNDQSGICTITCTTYDNDVSLGSNTCTFTVTASKSVNTPTITGTIMDTNATTVALTGNSSVLIKNKSTALCTITATPKNSATISSLKIGGVEVAGTTNDGVVTATKTYTGVSGTSFEFYAIDSRNYDNLYTVSPVIIDYISLTCNPIIYRNSPTGNSISMDISGNYYRGSFGAYDNVLKLQYRYKKVGGSYPSVPQTLEDGTITDDNGWITINSNSILNGKSSYNSAEEITLLSYPEIDDNDDVVYPGFDYRLNYEFQVKATDGASGYVLSTIIKTINIPRGIPVYDWSENDFNLNVPLMLNNINIFDIVFPVGAIYTHSDNIIPTVINEIGTWESIVTGISDVYAWKRTL